MKRRPVGKSANDLPGLKRLMPWPVGLLVVADEKAVGMDQGGWLEVESYTAYVHDVPEVRRSIVADLPIGIVANKKSA